MSGFPLSLRPMPADDKNGEPLFSQLDRMFQQKGLVNLSEEGLEAEIAAGATEDEDVVDEDNEEDDKLTRDELYKKRAEMMQSLHNAQNEVLLAIDFLSLLLSGVNSSAAETMSVNLKAVVPTGSLGQDKWNMPEEKPPAAKARQEALAKGYRLKGLNQAAGALLKSATTLQKEVTKDSKYWEELVSISEKGWSVQRWPRSKTLLGVKFGFSEAGPKFTNRGFVPLTSKENGSIMLHEELTQKSKAIRVRVAQDGRTIGTSRLPSLMPTSEMHIEGLIHRARDSLFDEELFHEMMVEARTLGSCQVKLRDDVIHIPTTVVKFPSSSGQLAGKEILVDLIPFDEIIPDSEDHSEDALAQSLALILRLLLSEAYRRSFIKRTSLPPPLTDRQASLPPHSIIRPLLNHFQHSRAVSSLRNYLNRTKSVFKSASLPLDFSVRTQTNLSKILEEFTKSNELSKTHSTMGELIQILGHPIETKATLTLPLNSESSAEFITVITKTQLAAPIFGTEYTLVFKSAISNLIFGAVAELQSSSSSSEQQLSFKDFGELAKYLDFVVSLAVVQGELLKDFGTKNWKPIDKKAECWTIVQRGKERGRMRVGVDASGLTGELALWSTFGDEPTRLEEVRWKESASLGAFKDVARKVLEGKGT